MRLEILVPVFNEEAVIHKFIRAVNLVFDGNAILSTWDVRITFVNDGSSDKTTDIILSQASSLPITIYELSRNFGHQAAVWAGLEQIKEESFVVVLDADLQDNPNFILGIIESFVNQNDVVLMTRVSRVDSAFKKLSAKLYYKLIQSITDGKSIPNVGDFFGLSPRAREALIQHQESVKYLRGLVQSLGYKVEVIPYAREAREAGVTHYPFSKMLRLAVSGITGFSISPLIYVAYLSVIVGLISASLVTFVLYLHYFSNYYLPAGWTFAIITTLFFSTSIMLSLGIISIYLARVSLEVKNRPTYLIQETLSKASTTEKRDDNEKE